MIPPEPDPPEPPADPDYTFRITNKMSQSYYFRVYCLNENGTRVLTDGTFFTSELIASNNTAEVVFPREVYETYSNHGFSVYYTSDLAGQWQLITFNVDSNRIYVLTPPSDADTFTADYAGVDWSNVASWS